MGTNVNSVTACRKVSYARTNCDQTPPEPIVEEFTRVFPVAGRAKSRAGPKPELRLTPVVAPGPTAQSVNTDME